MNQLAANIFWVGYVDWSIRDFHSYETVRGATYNSYLICDEKTALIDTVKAPYASELLRNIAERIELEKVDYVVCNHSELDHAGALPAVMAALPNATLLCNEKCKETLAGYFDISSWKIQTVAPGEVISLGKRSITFVNTPMVHWPESMVTWLPEEQILFSNDAFGQHLATSVRFDDQWDLDEIIEQAKIYYANIVTPYGRQVLKTLEAASKLPIKMIAPSHGLIWRKHLPELLSHYTDWASGKKAKKLVILYDSMWESTAAMAQEIQRGAMSVDETLCVPLLQVRKTGLTRIAAEMLDASAVAIGSATLNAQMMPAMAATLTYLKGLKFSEKLAVSFGSFGWGPGGAEAIAGWIEEVKYQTHCPPIKSKLRPTPAILEQCFQTGVELARKIID